MSSADVAYCTACLVDVLQLVIQHSNISKRLGSVCSLLSTSQQTAQIVVQNCVGKLHLRAWNPAQMAWFGKHWRLVHSLRTDAELRGAAMLEAIDQGLADAAARCREAVAGAQEGAAISQLQSIQGVASSLTVLDHLQTFTTLTSLRLDGRQSMTQGDKARACTALKGMTSLRCLAINALTNDLLPGTSSLTNLTSLTAWSLTPREGVPNLRHLPPQLEELTMSLFLDLGELQPPIDLSHVTGLTRLTAVTRSARDGWVVGHHARLFGGPNDQLPLNCRHLSVADVVSAQPLLELKHLERLELQDCCLSVNIVQEALQQLSSLSSLSNLQLNVAAVEVDEPTADVLQALPYLRGLRLWYSGVEAEDSFEVDAAVLRKLSKLTALKRLSMSNLALPDSSDCRIPDAVRSMRGLQSVCLCGCLVPELASVVGAMAGLPGLRCVSLADMPMWDEAASAALAAATQLTGLMFVSGRNMSMEFDSLVGQVHKLSGLRRLWMHSPGLDRFDVDAAAASLTGLTELCLRDHNDCDPHMLGPKFPRATLGLIMPGCALDLWGIDPSNTAAFRVSWWSPAKDEWERE